MNGPLQVENLTDDIDRLTRPFVCVVNDAESLSGAYRIAVPEGFVTDYCSVPHIPFIHEWLGDIGKRAGVIHDYLYSSIVDEVFRHLGRAWADNVLYAALRSQGIGRIKAWSMWAAVRVFGAGYFQDLSNHAAT